MSALPSGIFFEYPLVRLFPDWRRFDDVIDGVERSFWRAKINITSIKEESLDPNNNITDDDWDVYVACGDEMPTSQEIYKHGISKRIS